MRRVCFFFFNDTATTEIYTLSLHDALPIFPFIPGRSLASSTSPTPRFRGTNSGSERCGDIPKARRSEEHTSELQSRQYLVCRLLLEKTKNNQSTPERLRIPALLNHDQLNCH